MPAFRDMPIRQKLMFTVMVITGAALLLSAVGIIGFDSILFRRYLRRDISGLARMIGDNSTAALSFDDAQTATEILSALRARSHIMDACIYRANGSVLSRYARGGVREACPGPGEEDDIQFSRTALTASHAIVLRDHRIGTLTIAYDLGEIAERRQLYGGTVLGVLLASSLIAFLLSSKLRDTIATPILQLAQATVSVSRTRDYSIRAKKLSHDELGVLVDGFNEMLSGIQHRDNELRDALLAREDALREARNAHDSLEVTLSSIGDAVISTDLQGHVSFANRVALALLRQPEDEIKGRPLDEVFKIINEFTRAAVPSPVVEVLRDGKIVPMANHTVLLAGDGSEVPIDDSAAPIRRENGPVQGTVLVFRDVTARRKADETSRLLASIVESSADAMVTKDLRGIITSWNAGAQRIFGYSAAEMVGRPISVIAVPGREDEIPKILQKIARGERVENYETMRRTKDGRSIHVSLTISPLRDALG
ncbi:MAG: PAS domain S-box protein, partial [Acidobacteriota bacterium]|nr:PAS domain S-box protein [Acidobacteriota bacterium]